MPVHSQPDLFVQENQKRDNLPLNCCFASSASQSTFVRSSGPVPDVKISTPSQDERVNLTLEPETGGLAILVGVDRIRDTALDLIVP